MRILIFFKNLRQGNESRGICRYFTLVIVSTTSEVSVVILLRRYQCNNANLLHKIMLATKIRFQIFETLKFQMEKTFLPSKF